MPSLSIKDKIATVLAEKILKDLTEMTPVDHTFINDTRPTITRLFAELPEERQALLMYLLRQAMKPHHHELMLDIEALARKGLLDLEAVDTKSLEKMRREVHFVHGVVANTVLMSYGGLGEQRLVVEG